MAEQWDVLDIGRHHTGRLHTRGLPFAPGDFHLVIDAWIRGSDGRYLITRRTPDKDPFPGLWEPTCGAAQAGDTSLDAALREVREELGIQLAPEAGRLLDRYIDIPYRTHMDIWLFEVDVPMESIVLQAEEVDDVRWATKAEIIAMVEGGIFLGKGRLPYLDKLP